MGLKIGILTFHRSTNYGAFLQAFSLQSETQSFFGDRAWVEIIDYESQKAYNTYSGYRRSNGELYGNLKKAVKGLQKSKRYLRTDDLAEFTAFLNKQRYDLVVVGSDEVWKINGMRGFPNAFWLQDYKGKKITYGVSSRNDHADIKEEYRTIIRDAVKGFDYIGVRDEPTRKLIGKFCDDEKLHRNCDPVFLHDFGFDSSYRDQLVERTGAGEKKIMTVMIPDQRLVQLLHRRFGDRYHVVSLYDKHRFADADLTGIPPFEWIKAISCSDLMITNRFHGTCFSIKYNIPFLTLDDYDSIETSKVYDMLKRCGLEDRYCEYKGYHSDEKRRSILDRIEDLIDKDSDHSSAVETLKGDSRSYFDYLKEQYDL